MFRLCITIENRKLSLAILTVILILVFLFTVTVFPLISARAIGLITIVGTVTIGVAALASLLMITFGASGMDGAVRNQAAATGTEPLTYLGQLINRYGASAGGLLPQTFAARVSAGLSYLTNGDLFLDADATAAIADFQRWAWDADGAGLRDYAPLISADTVTVSGYNITLVSVTDLTWQYNNKTYYTMPGIVLGSTDYRLGCENADARFFVIALDNGNAAGVYVSPYNDLSFATLTYTERNNSFGWVQLHNLQMGKWDTLIYGGISPGNYSTIYPVTVGKPANGNLMPDTSGLQFGEVVVGDPDTFVGPFQQGQGTMLPLSDRVQVSPEAAANLHLSNYLRAVGAAYAGAGTATVPVTDVGTGEEETLPLSVPLDTPIGVVGVSDASIDQAGSVAASDAVASDFAGTDDFTMDLTRFFPFCIPFDLYAILTKFETAAEAPVINWTFDFGGLGTYPLTLDFSPYDSLASLLRDLETVAFAVGLMLITKRLIQGGD